MFSFAYIWVFLLLPLPWLVRVMLPPRRRSLQAVQVPFGYRLREVLGQGVSIERAQREVLRWLIPALIWVLLLTALARPQWIEEPVSKNLPTRDLLLLVDLSGSMSQEDFQNSAGEVVDRLTAVKEVVGEFLQRRDGDRVGLVVFGDAPYLQAPFSADLNLTRRLLDETAIGMAGPRTAFGDAIGLGVGLFDQSDAPAKTIIALTDGNDTKSQVPPMEAARVAAQRDIRIHTVAIGDPLTVGEEKLDEAVLRGVSEVTGGKYFFAANRSELEGIYTELDSIETREIKLISYRPRLDLFYWPLLAALLLSLLEKALFLLRRTRATMPPAEGSVRVNPTTGKLEVVG